MTHWQPGEQTVYPQQQQQWPPAQQPGWPPAQHAHAAPRPSRPPRPLPPAAVLVAFALGLVTAIALVVLLATGAVADLVRDTGLRSDDAAVIAALLGVLAVAGLLGGVVAALTGRGAGLLRSAGAGVAVLTLVLVAAAAVLGPQVGVATLLLGLLAVVAAGAVAAVASSRAVSAWSAAAERRSAEREIAALAHDRTTPLPARGAESLVLALFLVGAVVLGIAGSVAALAPAVAGAQVQEKEAAPEGSSSDAGPVPVGAGDDEFDGYLDDLAHRCADGDLSSCDDLYDESDLGGDYEDYGSTCGGRSGTDYYGECAIRFD